MGEMTVLNPMEVIERVVTAGDLSKLEPADRVAYYARVCESVGLNPLTRPFDYITLNGKLVLYAKRDAADQLRALHKIAIRIADQRAQDGLYIVTVEAKAADGRVDSDIGAVPFGQNVQGEARANAIMKAITKAKRRVTLSICGLGLLDETEVAGIPDAARWQEPGATALVASESTPAARLLQLHRPDGSVEADYATAGEWLAGLEIALKANAGFYAANEAFLAKLAGNRKVPVELREQAERIRERHGVAEAA